MDDLGASFWFKVAGLFVVAAIVFFIVMFIFVKAIYAWGFLAGLLVIAVLALVFGWFVDRRNAGIS